MWKQRSKEFLEIFSSELTGPLRKSHAVTGAPQLLWKKASGAQEDVGKDTKGKKGQSGQTETGVHCEITHSHREKCFILKISYPRESGSSSASMMNVLLSGNSSDCG
ncbi:hypothetical protein Q5P01_016000 [Channa striata]|uniref:Uncharacterized protein n=1 Tax=Channa striata TaxID=64152 RepID=A0AA88MH32_CHASR|nr:hypothetical protein Q5P01_016000 [Channa striata]